MAHEFTVVGSPPYNVQRVRYTRQKARFFFNFDCIDRAVTVVTAVVGDYLVDTSRKLENHLEKTSKYHAMNV